MATKLIPWSHWMTANMCYWPAVCLSKYIQNHNLGNLIEAMKTEYYQVRLQMSLPIYQWIAVPMGSLVNCKRINRMQNGQYSLTSKLRFLLWDNTFQFRILKSKGNFWKNCLIDTKLQGLLLLFKHKLLKFCPIRSKVSFKSNDAYATLILLLARGVGDWELLVFK